MELSFGNGALLLLLVAAVVAMGTRRLRLPYSVGLVVVGMALALLPMAPKISFTKEIIFNLLFRLLTRPGPLRSSDLAHLRG